MNTQHFSYNDIKQATYGFHDSNLLGKGGFGTVYKGIMRNTTFAIKLLKNVSWTTGYQIVIYYCLLIYCSFAGFNMIIVHSTAKTN